MENNFQRDLLAPFEQFSDALAKLLLQEQFAEISSIDLKLTKDKIVSIVTDTMESLPVEFKIFKFPVESYVGKRQLYKEPAVKGISISSMTNTKSSNTGISRSSSVNAAAAIPVIDSKQTPVIASKQTILNVKEKYAAAANEFVSSLQIDNAIKEAVRKEIEKIVTNCIVDLTVEE